MMRQRRHDGYRCSYFQLLIVASSLWWFGSAKETNVLHRSETQTHDRRHSRVHAAASALVQRQQQQRDSQEEDGELELDRGNPTCDHYDAGMTSNSSNTQPCRDPDHNDNDSGDDQGKDANDGITAQPPPTEGPSDSNDLHNEVTLSFYMSLRPSQPSMGRIVSKAITFFLNQTQTNFRMYFRSPPARLVNATGNRRHLRWNDGSSEKDTLDQTQLDNHQDRLLQRQGWDMFYLNTDSRLLQRREKAWWWQYDIVYLCYWSRTPNDGPRRPVQNQTILLQVTNDLSNGLQTSIYDGTFRNYVKDRFGEVYGEHDFSMTAPEYSGGSSVDDPGAAIDNLNNKTAEPTGGVNVGNEGDDETPALKPLDPRQWTWQRYAGLGVFLFTFCFTCTFMQLAAYRHRQLKAQELWGNLATQEGVDELLKTGWKVKGSRMEVYNKSKFGYEDDGSMLIGGFEQRESVVGAEIVTVTQPESEATPETHYTHGTPNFPPVGR